MANPSIVHNVSGPLREVGKAEIAAILGKSEHDVDSLMHERLAWFPGLRGLVVFTDLELRGGPEVREPGAEAVCLWGADGMTFTEATLPTARMGDVPSRFKFPTVIYHHTFK